MGVTFGEHFEIPRRLVQFSFDIRVLDFSWQTHVFFKSTMSEALGGHIKICIYFLGMFPINYMPFLICKLDTQTQSSQKHKENQGGGLRPPPQRSGPPPAAHPFVGILIVLVFL